MSNGERESSRISEQLDQGDEGTVTFRIRESNLSSVESDGAIIQSVESTSGDCGYKLWKREPNELVYEFFRVDAGLRRCAVNMDEFQGYSDFFVALTWSTEEISISIGPDSGEYDGDLLTESSSDQIAQVRQDSTDQLVIVGDQGVDVGFFNIHQSGRETLRPLGKEIFDFTETKSRILLDVAGETEQFLVESTLIQQIIVMLVTGLETYLQERYIELAADQGIDDDELADALAAESPFSANEIKAIAERDSTEIQNLVRKQYFSFQDLDEAHNLYDRTFEFDLLGTLNESGHRGLIERNIAARHSIIHEETDMTILNLERVPRQDPVFANHDYGLNVIEGFSDAVEQIHQSTQTD